MAQSVRQSPPFTAQAWRTGRAMEHGAAFKMPASKIGKLVKWNLSKIGKLVKWTLSKIGKLVKWNLSNEATRQTLAEIPERQIAGRFRHGRNYFEEWQAELFHEMGFSEAD